MTAQPVQRHHRTHRLALLTACAAIVAGCSSGDESTTTPPPPTDAAPAPSADPTQAPDTAAQQPVDTTVVVDTTVPEPPVTTSQLDCADQLPTYVESAIPGGVDNPRLTCWAMNTLENYADPAGRRIDVTYYVWEADGAAADRPADPVFYAPGGPRGSAFNSLRIFTNRDIQGDRDLVLMDTRGNGPIPGDELGLPLSGCPEVYAAVIEVFSTNLALADEYANNEAAWTACADRLRAEGWDFSQYQSIAVVEDLERLRRTLGYEQVNFFGESYSTLYGLQWMRAHPDSLRSVVLDSVVLPDNSWAPTDLVAPSQALLAWVVEQCEASATCNSANPNLPAALDQAVAALNADPYEVEITSNVTGEPATLSLDGADLMFIIDGALSPSTITAVPGLITAWASGDFSILDVYASEFQDNASGGLMTSGAVVCHDSRDVMRSVDDVLEVDEAWRHVGYLPNMACTAVGVPSSSTDFNEAVTADIPTLVVIGVLDTATPAQASRTAAQTLSQSVVVEFDWQGHVPVRSDDCALSIVTSFYDNPAAPDVACVEQANATPLVFG
jgi:pimeloyl-ACP methyl ester carboxylesterase